MPEFDFGYDPMKASAAGSSGTNGNSGDGGQQDGLILPPNENATDLDDNNGQPPVRGGDTGTGTGDADKDDKGDGNKNDDKNSNKGVELTEGDIVEVGEEKYTVDANGNLFNSKGEIFKDAKDVKDFIAQFDATNDDEMTMANVLAKVGIEIVDENNKPIEFEDNPDGVAAYIQAVIDKNQEEYAIAGVNKLIDTYPFIKDVIDYYVANGGSLDGFGELKDRSNIIIDEANVAQQEAIVREAHKEFGRRDNVDKYVQYLKDSGQLLDVAKENLKAMQDADKAEREETAKQAAARQKDYEEQQTKYWQGVQDAIKGRKIAGYQIPETIMLEKDGKKIATTPDDFFNYLYQVDENGISHYVHDLQNLTPEQRRDDELLRAYLTYTGGSYADLVNMAIKEKEVKTLKLRAITNQKRGITVRKPDSNKGNSAIDSNFGY